MENYIPLPPSSPVSALFQCPLLLCFFEPRMEKLTGVFGYFLRCQM